MDHIKLTTDPLSVDEVTKLVKDPSCGAISIFAGTTRDVFEGQTVIRLEYESYEGMADKEIKKLCHQAREKWTLKHIAVYHRLGLVPVSEASVLLAVSSVHRRESLDAVSFLIDALKANVPIWKKEVYKDGSGDWKQNKECVWTKKDGTDGNADREENGNNAKRKLEVTDEPEREPLLKKIKTEPSDTMDLLDKPISTSAVPKTVIKVEKEIADDKNTPSYEPKSTCTVAETVVKVEKETVDDKNTPSCENDKPPKIDPRYVQIVASKEELFRRIRAFQQRKREELDVLNVQEFCTMSGSVTSLSSCARTSAVVLRSKDSKSHLKLTRVVNEWGPQTLGKDPGSMSSSIIKPKGGNTSNGSSREGSIERCSATGRNQATAASRKMENKDFSVFENLPPGLDERIHNLETHLKIGLSTPVPRDIYARLKSIEDRVLHLESISPEYFGTKNMKIPQNNTYKEEVKAVEDDLSVHELDIRIHELRMKLKGRQLKCTY